MKQVIVSKEEKTLKGEITLTSSKSESNRILIIQSLCEDKFTISNLATAKDTETLQELLNSKKNSWDVGPAGTTMRFLTAYASIQEGREIVLTGSDRMKERPIGILVEALRSIGADIEYVENDGFPPIRVVGKKLKGGVVTMDGSVSSQFVSALMLVAPVLEDGLVIRFDGKIASKPYLNMTHEVMKKFGAEVMWEDDNTLRVNSKAYKPVDHIVEADWSAASYWYEIAGFCDEVDFAINGLFSNSLQADSIVVELYKSFGVETEFGEKGIRLTKTNIEAKGGNIDFESCPDIAQTLSCTYSLLGLKGRFTGLESLRIKETDRIEALRVELEKLGYEIDVQKDDMIFSNTKKEILSQEIDTYHDHRMAMAFAPISVVMDKIVVNDPGVVVKSYPEYWKDLEKMGFKLEFTS